MSGPAKVRAKFWVNKKQYHHNGQNNDSVSATIELIPCYGSYPGGDAEENKSFSKWTPNGKVEMTITNPDAIEAFDLGKPYYIDFTPAD